MADKKTLKLTVEYRMELEDTTVANILRDVLLREKGTMFGDNYGIFDLEPKETVTEVIVE